MSILNENAHYHENHTHKAKAKLTVAITQLLPLILPTL